MQRVSRASVTIQSGADRGTVTGAIGHGLVALVGVTHDDGPEQARALASKVWHLRVFDGAGDDGAPTEVSVGAAGGEVLVVSQFTLYGDTRKGRRPTWIDAARPE
ncbi:MAG: D-aminoacyl-tRNA deacylase, partial [Acidimicrobiales bacterium]|nr:D-aminoacyl-tRNA deacylase [Acidimicrobiales bacterium]